MSSRMNGEVRSLGGASRRMVDRSPLSRRPQSFEEACSAGAAPPPLSLHDRVVWLSDNGPEFGYVKWLGKLPDVGIDWMAGVDFDNPVGSGTGLYNDHQLFEAPMNHASLVPVIGLMKAEDFAPDQASLTAVHDGTTTKTTSQTRLSSSRSSGRNRDLLPAGAVSQTSFRNQPPANNSIQSVVQLNLSEKVPSEEINDVQNPKTSSQLKSSSTSDGLRDAVTDGPRDHLSPQVHSSTLSVRVNGKSLSEEAGSNEDLEVESLVEVTVDDVPRFGVIRWIGCLDYAGSDTDTYDVEKMVGVELEEECVGCCDGSWNGKRYFSCAPRRGIFIPLTECKKDSRFDLERRRSTAFGSIDCPSVTGDIPPLTTPEQLKALCGKNRGIQGHHNSCYLDATLFAMFSCTTIFESLLNRPPKKDDIPEYSEVQRVLKEEIVNPLRANLYVRADRVMHLRTLLEKLSSVRGLTSEEKDPEEFLNLLLNEILKADPYLKLSSGLESFLYQILGEKDPKLTHPTVQQLFDKSFQASNFKLRQIPPALLIQMPRSGTQYKMYQRIVPSMYLDITDVLENSPRQCCVCGLSAELECKECFGHFGEGGLESTVFCGKCYEKTHGPKTKRAKHQLTRLLIPNEYVQLKEHASVPRVYMELFAVLCIETSHYVAFVKCGSGPDAPWCFFDSMADRKGEKDGYNLPEVRLFDFGDIHLQVNEDDKALPDTAKRLLCDAYICFYQSPDIKMYR